MEVALFNPNDMAYFMVNAGQRQEIDKMKSMGFVETQRLTSMYHPGYKKYAMVLPADEKVWEDKGYFSHPTMVYRPSELEPRLVSEKEAKKLLGEGWYASPAHFPGNSEGKLKTLTLKEAS